MKCVTNSYTYLGDSYLQPLYVEKPSSIRDVSDKMWAYVRVLIHWIQGMIHSSVAYGADRHTP